MKEEHTSTYIVVKDTSTICGVVVSGVLQGIHGCLLAFPTCRSNMRVASIYPSYNLICDLCGEPRSCGVEVSIWDFDTFIKIFP